MKRWIEGLSHTGECATVVLLAFGFFLFSSLSSFIAAPQGAVQFSDADLQFLVVFEVLTMAIVIGILAARGWTLSAIGLAPDTKQTIAGILLAFATMAAHAVFTLTVDQSSQHVTSGDTLAPASELTLTWILAASLINPLYEEVFVAGYLMSALKERYAPWIAVTASVALRTAYHLYQGIYGALGIALVGLIFALYYHRTQRLWPLIVAHAVLDLLALSSLQGTP